MAYKQGDLIKLDMSFAAEKVAADAPEGTIAGIASTPTTDLYGHKVLKGAFDKSIKKKGLTGPRGIKLLAYHDWSKPAGVINTLKTVGDELRLDALLNLNISYVKDMYEAAKQNDGLSFSVGFTLEEYTFVDGDKSVDGEWLVVKQGDLMEVSVVAFPALLEAEMTFIKQCETMSELEKALAASEFCRSRNEAHKLAKYLKANQHLFLDQAAPSVEPVEHPLLDVQMLKPMRDRIAQIKALL